MSVIISEERYGSSNYTYPLFGRPAKTSIAPALLAYKTGLPIIVVTCKRTQNGYVAEFSPPLYPNKERPHKEEVKRLMDKAMCLLEARITDSPQEWLWMHNRWKP